jgi:hypothetical protein
MFNNAGHRRALLAANAGIDANSGPIAFALINVEYRQHIAYGVQETKKVTI